MNKVNTLQTVEVVPTEAPETVILMRATIIDAIGLFPACNTPEKMKYLVDLLVQLCASSYLAGMMATAKCELGIEDIVRVAYTRLAPFTEDELKNAYNIIVDNSTHGLGGNTNE